MPLRKRRSLSPRPSLRSISPPPAWRRSSSSISPRSTPAWPPPTAKPSPPRLPRDAPSAPAPLPPPTSTASASKARTRPNNSAPSSIGCCARPAATKHRVTTNRELHQECCSGFIDRQQLSPVTSRHFRTSLNVGLREVPEKFPPEDQCVHGH